MARKAKALPQLTIINIPSHCSLSHGLSHERTPGRPHRLRPSMEVIESEASSPRALEHGVLHPGLFHGEVSYAQN
jgi:hypothetical protein